MALSTTKSLDLLRSDFLSGRDLRAYIPLAEGLRREKSFADALDVVHRGLARDPDSVKGRTLLMRVLSDLGRYDEALQEAGRYESRGVTVPESPNLLLEKARAEISLHMAEEAGETLDHLDQLLPMEAQVQALRSQWRELDRRARERRLTPEKAGEASRGLIPEQFLPVLRDEVEALGKVLAVALVDLETRRSYVEGDAVLTEGAALYEREVAETCEDLGHGTLRYAIIETQQAVVIVVSLGTRLVVVGMDAGVNRGKLQYRVLSVVERHLPEGRALSETDTREDP